MQEVSEEQRNSDTLFRERESLYLRLQTPISKPKDSPFNLPQTFCTGFPRVSCNKVILTHFLRG